MKPLLDKICQLEKFPGKGGWTYARIPEIKKDTTQPFGWVKVRGTIDGFEIRKYHLMPLGNGELFLPVKAQIRKQIKKEAGATVHVILYPDYEPLVIPDEFNDCLQDDPDALAFFNSLSESEQNNYLKWIYSAKQDTTKVKRIAESLKKLNGKMRLYDKPNIA